MDGETVLRIRAWERVFLNHKTRGRKGRLRWIQLPVRLDDPDYAALASTPAGVSALGVWMGVLELAGTLDRRDGTLATSNNRPLSQREIAGLIRMPEKTVTAGIEALMSAGWIEGGLSETRSHDSETPPPLVEWSGVERSITTLPPALTRGGVCGNGAKEQQKAQQKEQPRHQRSAEVAEHLGDCIAAWKPDAKIKTEAGVSLAEIDRMLRLDGRDPDRCKDLMWWLFRGPPDGYIPDGAFDWRPNVMSGGALRRQYDRLDVLFTRHREGCKP
jgi:hypothetical protein